MMINAIFNHMKLSMMGEEKGDILIQVTLWAGLTVQLYFVYCRCMYMT